MPTLPIVILLAGALMLNAGCQRAVSPSLEMQQKFFSSLKVSDPEEGKAMRFAQYYMLVGRFDLAQQELQRAINQDPNNIKLLNALGSCYDQSGKYSKAQETYQKILAQDPEHPLAHNNLGYSYYLAGDFNRAENTFQEVLAKHPGNTMARNNLGLVWCRQGKEQQALSLWQKTDGELGAREKLHQVVAYLGKPVDTPAKDSAASQDLAKLSPRPRNGKEDTSEKLARKVDLAPTGKITGGPKPLLPETAVAPAPVAKSPKPTGDPARLSQNPKVKVEEVEMVIQPASYSPPPLPAGTPEASPLLISPPHQVLPQATPSKTNLPLTKDLLIPAKPDRSTARDHGVLAQPQTEKGIRKAKMVVYMPEKPYKSMREYISKGYSHKNHSEIIKPEAAVF